jgi:6-phosphogluconolactonase
MHTFSTIVRLTVITLIFWSIVTTSQAELSNSYHPATKTRVYISTYTESGDDGIYLAELDYVTGDLQRVRLAVAAKKASFLALHPNRRYLYATCEVDEYHDSKRGAVSAFKIDPPTGNLTLLNHQPSTGEGPHYLSLDREGKYALVANYHAGSVAALPIRADGTLGKATSAVRHRGSSVIKNRQAGPHPHGIDVDPSNRFVFVPDLGLDKVMAYRFDDAGKLTPNHPSALATSPGSGPRHIAFHPNRNWAYIIHELDSTVTALTYDAEAGVLTCSDTVSTLPAGAAKNNITGEIAIHPNGKYLYASNRGHNSIALFAIDQISGRIVSIGHYPARGDNPRNFAIDPTGKFLLSANLGSDSVTVLQIDLGNGSLSPTAHAVNIVQPYCIKFYSK